ncbi:hypothetical protein P152DRAFT_514801 [Eremomyces bilateralis CBS 781.70]|uniref:Uncharacterized protein n=1 Tax=Eremomyces bilateralis CBS 781.70 TaxID=1392243 RepID=A0A6G1G1H8_9PEZI|nr:uncharacterized protein P152DRAFT_514801 [Eremomyces bilateralis CBS 781.70]KAF1811659.1 hypothetical protein P152DRAFT_514801 [Eremomyces bilateralis CBS 781.70]
MPGHHPRCPTTPENNARPRTPTSSHRRVPPSAATSCARVPPHAISPHAAPIVGVGDDVEGGYGRIGGPLGIGLDGRGGDGVWVGRTGWLGRCVMGWEVGGGGYTGDIGFLSGSCDILAHHCSVYTWRVGRRLFVDLMEVEQTPIPAAITHSLPSSCSLAAAATRCGTVIYRISCGALIWGD